MRDAIWIHNLRSSQLVLACVHFLAQQLVQGRVARQNHGALSKQERKTNQ